MPREAITIPFPIKGLHQGSSYANQPELTTPSCMNVRRDPVTDRQRGGTRNGLGRYYPSQVNSTNAITCGTSVTKIDDRVTYTTKTSISAATTQTAQPSRLDTISIAVDMQSNLFTAAATSGGGTGLNALVKYNSALQRQWTWTLPQGRNTDVLKSIKIDQNLDGTAAIYCVVTGSVAGPTRIYKVIEEIFPGPVRVDWFIDAPNGGWWTDCSVKDGVMYAVELITGHGGMYLHRFDDVNTSQYTLTWSALIRASGATQEECYAICHGDDGSAILAIVDPDGTINQDGKTEKYGPMLPNTTTTPPTATDGGSAFVWSINQGGMGQAIVNKNGYLYTQGYTSNNTTGGTNATVRKLRDDGASVTGISQIAIDGDTRFKGANSLAVDEQGNVYVTTDKVGLDTCVTKINSSFSNVWEITGTILGVNDMNAYAVAVDPMVADEGGSTEQAEWLYVGTEAEASNYYTIHKVHLVDVAHATDGSARSTFSYVVSGGAFKHLTSTAVNTVAGSSSVNTTARWIQMAAGLNRVLCTDGLNYFTIDPLNGTYGTSAAWVASTGQIPPRGRLLSIWAGAAVIAGFEQDPHEWAMSAVNDFDDWNFFPLELSNADAVLGTDSRAGVCPDVITALIPWSDDLLFFGGDHSIWRMSGHPLEGGRFDLVSDITGVAWGTAWCKTPSGAVYFVGSRGGFYSIGPSSSPEEMSVEPLSDFFRDLNIGNNKIQLVWNDKEKGVHIFVTPFTAGATTHFFWSARDNAWWPDRFATTDMDPVSVWTLDGDDPADREVLMGGRDSYVRKFRESFRQDDGYAIESWVYMPVFAPPAYEIRLSNFRVVMGKDSDFTQFNVYATDEPDFNIISTDPFVSLTQVPTGYTGTITSLRNDNIRARVRGNAVFMRVRTNALYKAWQVESITVDRELAGRARNRSRPNDYNDDGGDVNNFFYDTDTGSDIPIQYYGLTPSNGGGVVPEDGGDPGSIGTPGSNPDPNDVPFDDPPIGDYGGTIGGVATGTI